jgi:hypothetical protein
MPSNPTLVRNCKTLKYEYNFEFASISLLSCYVDIVPNLFFFLSTLCSFSPISLSLYLFVFSVFKKRVHNFTLKTRK